MTIEDAVLCLEWALGELDKGLKEVTEGPWERGVDYFESRGPGECQITPVGEFAILAKVYLPRLGERGFEEGGANARFIASARTWVPTLRDSIEAALTEWKKASAVNSWGDISDPAYGQGCVILALATPWEQAFRSGQSPKGQGGMK